MSAPIIQPAWTGREAYHKAVETRKSCEALLAWCATHRDYCSQWEDLMAKLTGAVEGLCHAEDRIDEDDDGDPLPGDLP